MNFKEWFIAQEARFKGLKRLFDKEHEEFPKYVRNDLYNNRAAYTMRRLSDNPANIPTISLAGSSGYNRSKDSEIPSDVPSRIFNAYPFKNVKFTKEPVVIYVSPLDFNEKSLRIFMERLFGFRPDDRIRDDEKRNKMQRKNVSLKGDNEPIIVIKDGNKYELLEGWHRTMANLVFDGNDGTGAPPHHIEMLKLGELPNIEELTMWKKVPIKAYVGIKIKPTVN